MQDLTTLPVRKPTRDRLAYITGPDGEWIELMAPR